MKRFLLLVLAIVAAPPVFARTIRVPLEAPTIQAGLDSLQDSDTVLVARGTYAEALYAPPLHFVLRGDVTPDTGDYPRPVIDPTSLPGSDTLSCLTLPDSSFPIVEDLVFRNGLAMYPHNYDDGGIECHALEPVFRRIVMDSVIYALTVYRTQAIVTLDSCRFLRICQSGVLALDCSVIATNCLFSQNQAVMVNCGNGSIISGCRFEAEQSPADYMLQIGGNDPHSSRIENCRFRSSQPMMGPAVYAYFGGNGVGPPIEFLNDDFEGLSGLSVLIQYNFPDFPTVNLSANRFQNNHVTCCAGAIEFRQAASFDQGILAQINDNWFSVCSGSANRANAIQLCAGASLQRNRFVDLGPDPSPAVRMAYDTVGSAVSLQYNLFLNTGAALRNDQRETPVDARWNWWGDSTGPYHATHNPGGLGDTIVGWVDFDPWCPDTFCFESAPEHPDLLSPSSFLLSAYPNPFNSTLHLTLVPSQIGIVKVELFDILGRTTSEIWHGPLAFQKEITFDASSLASGIYFARVTDVISRKNLAMTKLVLLR